MMCYKSIYLRFDVDIKCIFDLFKWIYLSTAMQIYLAGFLHFI